ncbi:putative Delta-1-pyrroline-5-carboxylate dehydrogenase 12A1 [Paratrimastix pyriformis]|uniref:Delta-1-pyrroline-5-carboxylate dehydrogenase 12A1 n=1 Tax=Paratrimastix pyriformis TaxID=342808 RepID=A0ABQ8UDH5_9EUKA|nr:putative Delta-1-pyrroline-5-carboxylate dehydrogenase 12A1 [Paratrimastix pyriformis]
MVGALNAKHGHEEAANFLALSWTRSASPLARAARDERFWISELGLIRSIFNLRRTPCDFAQSSGWRMGAPFIKMPNTKADELEPFVTSLNSCPKTGLHNPFKNVERYLLYGQVSAKMAELLGKEDVANYFAKCIQRVCPKSWPQALGEVTIVRVFLQNFCGDQVRFLARGFSVPGNHYGQRSHGHRWPYGPCCLVSPFNFPLEIPALQLMGALYMGNKVTLKAASTTSLVMEAFLRFMHFCGAPKTDVDFLNCAGSVFSEFVGRAQPRNTQFTGGSEAAESLAVLTHGKVRLEDAGFDWKILGPDVRAVDYVAWQSDQDAYANSGQKCSAQSILFAHENWLQAGLLDKLKTLAERRSLEDLTVGPVLSHTTEDMLAHVHKLASLPRARVLFGGVELPRHNIPKRFGALAPTAVYVPLEEILKPENFKDCIREIFGPFQVVTSFTDATVDRVLECCERMSHHLTAAVVSNDMDFINRVVGHTVNGTTYVGIRARTTGAPQNHWFGPAGDPRGAGIGTPESIQLVWSCHREIIEDFNVPPHTWTLPAPS